MGYYSTINGAIEAPSREILAEILEMAKAEDLFDEMDVESGSTRATFYGRGKYYDEWMVPFYEACASRGCTGTFERTGEEFGDMEQVDIYPGKIERRYAEFPPPGEGTIIEVPLAGEKAAKEKNRPRTTGPGL